MELASDVNLPGGVVAVWLGGTREAIGCLSCCFGFANRSEVSQAAMRGYARREMRPWAAFSGGAEKPKEKINVVTAFCEERRSGSLG